MTTSSTIQTTSSTIQTTSSETATLRSCLFLAFLVSCGSDPLATVTLKTGFDRAPAPTFIIDYQTSAWTGYSSIVVQVLDGVGSGQLVWASGTQQQPKTNVVREIVYGVDPPGFISNQNQDGTRVLKPLRAGDRGTFSFGPGSSATPSDPPGVSANFLIAADGRVILK